MDKAIILALLPFSLSVLVVGWLIYASSGKRSIRLNIKGLGMSILIDTAVQTGDKQQRKESQ